MGLNRTEEEEGGGCVCVPDECVEGCCYNTTTTLFYLSPLDMHECILKLVALSFQRTNSHTTSERNAKGGEVLTEYVDFTEIDGKLQCYKGE